MTAASGDIQINAALLLTLEAFMRRRNLSYRRAARAVGIDPAIAHDAEARVPLRLVAQLLENVARDTDNDAFGAQLGLAFRVGTAGTLDYVISNAPTLRVAFRDFMRFLGLVADGFDARFVERRSVSYFVTHLPAAFGPRAQLIDVRSSARLLRIRHMLRDPAFPVLVELQRKRPKSIAEFRRIFGPRVKFGQRENRIGIATAALDRSLPAADPLLYRVVVEAARKAMAERGRKVAPLSPVVSFIGTNLAHGEVTIASAADDLGTSVFRLRKLLGERGTSFRGLLDGTRKAMANHYVNETSLPMTEIAFLLGFSELSAFSRATRKWFGRSPRELRKHAGTRH